MIETQKLLKFSKDVVILCDHREKMIANLLSSFNAKVKLMNLSVADFVCSERVGVERKSASDFLKSLCDGRIFEQAEKMRDSFEKPVIVIEGEVDLNQSNISALIANLLANYDVSIIFVRKPVETAKIVYWLAKKEQEKNVPIGFKIFKKPKDIKKIQEFIVASIPGISRKLSKRLLKKFGSVEKVFTASESELKKVEGIGEKTAKKIRKILTSRYGVTG